VADVYRSMIGLTVGGRVEAGVVAPGDRVMMSPLGETATVKAVHARGTPLTLATVGDNVDIGLVGAYVHRCC
jgi:translation elongation factor EF-1alpha